MRRPILVIDNYDSFTYNLVHMLTPRGFDVIVRRNDELTVDEALAMEAGAILISPGPGRPGSAGISIELIMRSGETPLLGVCLGHQAIAEAFGGRVVQAPSLMHGKTSEIQHEGEGVFAGLPSSFTATRYHSLAVDVESLPDELEVTAATADGVIMGLRHRGRPVEGIQFHPESILTTAGPRLMANWLSGFAV